MTTVNGVRLRLVPLDGPAEADLSELSADERARAGRFFWMGDAERFARGRAALRRALGGELGLPPGDVPIAYGAQGKPELEGGGVWFNLSHAEGKALIAVSRGGPVGVDLERLRAVPDAGALAAALFSPAERAEWDAASDRDAAFLRLWTRKEAYLKARGIGLSRGAGAEPEPGWEIEDLEPLPGYVGALAYHAGASSRDWTVGFLGGVLLALMVYCNAVLAKLTTPLFAAWAAHGLGAFAALGLVLFHRARGGASKAKAAAPAWSYLGGLPGAFTVVLAGITINSSLGLPGSIAFMLVGQVAFGWVCDALGLFGMPRRRITLADLGAGLVVLAGSALIIFGRGVR